MEKFKFSLRERQIVGMDVARTTYETNIGIKDHVSLDRLKKSVAEGICLNLGIDNPADIHLDFAVSLKAEIGVKYTNQNYTLVIHESGRIKRLPEVFTVEAKDS